MKVYMEVTLDELSLPLVVADTLDVFALKVGLDKRRISEQISRAKKANRQCRFIIIDINIS